MIVWFLHMLRLLYSERDLQRILQKSMFVGCENVLLCREITWSISFGEMIKMTNFGREP